MSSWGTAKLFARSRFQLMINLSFIYRLLYRKMDVKINNNKFPHFHFEFPHLCRKSSSRSIDHWPFTVGNTCWLSVSSENRFRFVFTWRKMFILCRLLGIVLMLHFFFSQILEPIWATRCLMASTMDRKNTILTVHKSWTGLGILEWRKLSSPLERSSTASQLSRLQLQMVSLSRVPWSAFYAKRFACRSIILHSWHTSNALQWILGQSR